MNDSDTNLQITFPTENGWRFGNAKYWCYWSQINLFELYSVLDGFNSSKQSNSNALLSTLILYSMDNVACCCTEHIHGKFSGNSLHSISNTGRTCSSELGDV